MSFFAHDRRYATRRFNQDVSMLSMDATCAVVMREQALIGESGRFAVVDARRFLVAVVVNV
jgi:hypothetical protein